MGAAHLQLTVKHWEDMQIPVIMFYLFVSQKKRFDRRLISIYTVNFYFIYLPI